MIYMLNELSIQQVNSRQAAFELLENFVKASVRANQAGIAELRLFENSLKNLYQLDIHAEYSIDSWLKDSTIGSDLQDKFREIVTSFPLITEHEVHQNDFYQRSEFYKTLDGYTYQVFGLGAALIYDSIAISFATHAEWKQTAVEVAHYYIKEDGTDVNEKAWVRNFSDVDSFESHLPWWHALQQSSLKRSLELWERREEFFPNLIFCRELEKQLQRVGVSKMLSQIIDRLRTLDQYVSNWKEGNFNYEDVNSKTNLKISPESDTTLQKFSSSRKFTIPGLGKKVFDLHIKTGDLRFHFYPDNEEKKVYIGYIGKHLRIASQD